VGRRRSAQKAEATCASRRAAVGLPKDPRTDENNHEMNHEPVELGGVVVEQTERRDEKKESQEGSTSEAPRFSTNRPFVGAGAVVPPNTGCLPKVKALPRPNTR